MYELFDPNRMFMMDLPPIFLVEVAFRSAVTFIILLMVIKLTGKRGVRQLSIFETVIIIALGSAAGDPMFYEDVGLIPAFVVFVVVIILYKLITYFTAKSRRFEIFMEGEVKCLIEDGRFALGSFKKEDLAQDEFFSELRVQSVEHLGQIKYAYLETTGDVSIYFYADEDVKNGLPIIPYLFENKSKLIVEKGLYACTFCGNNAEQNPGTAKCKVCHKEEWVKAIDSKRIS